MIVTALLAVKMTFPYEEQEYLRFRGNTVKMSTNSKNMLVANSLIFSLRCICVCAFSFERCAE